MMRIVWLEREKKIPPLAQSRNFRKKKINFAVFFTRIEISNVSFHFTFFVPLRHVFQIWFLPFRRTSLNAFFFFVTRKNYLHCREDKFKKKTCFFNSKLHTFIFHSFCDFIELLFKSDFNQLVVISSVYVLVVNEQFFTPSGPSTQ